MLRALDPTIVRGLLAADEFVALRDGLRGISLKGLDLQPASGRYVLHSSKSELLARHHERLVPRAREIFESPTLCASHAMFVRYEGGPATLERHRDTNACEYVLDLCLYQSEPWDLFVVDQPYAWGENEALAFYGTEQEHWREAPLAPENRVGLAFFNFVEQDHWFFTVGRHQQDAIERLDRIGRGLSAPDHRVFVALMVAARSSADFYRRVAARYGDPDPVERVFAWVDELCGPGVAHSPLGLKFNASVMQIARRLAAGASPRAVAEWLSARRRAPVSEGQVAAVAAELRGSLLAILFPPPGAPLRGAP